MDINVPAYQQISQYKFINRFLLKLYIKIIYKDC
jgi:hypothetical protein